MSILLGVIGSIQGEGGSSKSASWYGITWEPVQEGQENHAQVQFTNWDNTTVYWTVVGTGNSYIGAQLVSYNGTLNPGTGDSIQDIYFTFNADATTDGNLTYYVNIGSSIGNYDLAIGGPFTCRDSSQTAAVILDLDPANYIVGNPNVWPDTSGNNYNAGIYSYAWNSSEANGVMVFDGSTSCEVQGLGTGINYSTLSASMWFNIDAVSGSTQTLIAKELVFKLRISSDGRINILTSTDGSNWNGGSGTTSGGENLTAGVWNHVAFTVSSTDNVRVYLNGSLVANFSQTTLGRNNNPFDIGMWQTTGSPQDHFAGKIGEVKVWNYGLTAQQVFDNYANTVNRYIPQLPEFDLNNLPNSVDPWVDAVSGVSANLLGDWTYDSDYGGGAVFDGTFNGYIEVEGVNTIGGSYTISVVGNFCAPYTGAHNNTIFDGSSSSDTSIVGYLGDGALIVGLNDGSSTLVSSGASTTGLSWWDFVYAESTLTVYKNGVEVMSGSISTANRGWSSNLRFGCSYDDLYSTMIGTFYRIKYRKVAVSYDNMLDQYNSIVDDYGFSPIYRSLVYNGSTSTLHVDSNLGDWLLGTTYTIEFWCKPTTTSAGSLQTIMGQGASQVGIDIGFQDEKFLLANSQLTDVPQPPTGVWTHVAVVGDGTHTKIYYDGIVVKTMSVVGFNNQDDDLYIGKRGSNNFQYFNGKMTDIHINFTALYSGAFTPPTIVYPVVGSLLVLNRFAPRTDSVGRHGISYNMAHSTEVPNQVTGTLSDASGGPYGNVYYTYGDPLLSFIESVPIGAQITSNLWSGFRTVTASQSWAGGWQISYDATGLSGTTSTSDSFNYFW